MPAAPVVAIEVGTTKVVAVVGEMRDDGRLLFSGLGEHASKGVRKGEVIDLANAVVCVRGALQAAEESGQVTIREAHLALSGAHIQSQVTRGSIRVANPHEITRADIEQVMDLARAINLPPDREIIHTICQYFRIDDQKFVTNPEGLAGAKLSLDMLALHGVRTRLQNTVKVVESVPMDVADVAFSGLCAALAVLTPEQKETGVIVIDIGGGTTDFVAYIGKSLAIAGSLSVGGDHVTNDIALAFSVSMRQAESLKTETGSAVIEKVAPELTVELPPETGFPGRSVALSALHTVINARMDEIFRMVKAQLAQFDLQHQTGAGVALTGGGARMKGIVELAEEVFGLPCMVGRPVDADGITVLLDGPEYAAPVGMIRYGVRSVERATSSGFGGFISKIFKR